MMTTEDQIEKLTKSWKPRIVDEPWPWWPLGKEDGFCIENERIDPIGELSECRDGPVSGPDIEISDECRTHLSTIWNSTSQTELPTTTCGKVSNIPHFHCYHFPQASLKKYFSDWARHKAYSHSHRYVWWCSSVLDAAHKYSWPIKPTVGPFEPLALALQTAIRANDNLRAAAICLLIAQWGGTRPKYLKNWLIREATAGTLCGSLVDATRLLIPQSTHPLSSFDGKKYFMDSTSTKIYAAVAMDLTSGTANPKQDVLIYDSRVAAALGLITRCAVARFGITRLPPHLQFPVDQSQLNKDKRDPSCFPYQFPGFAHTASGHINRATYAVRAAQYIQAIIGINAPSAEFIEAEKGLFMIGYDVSERCDRTRYCP